VSLVLGLDTVAEELRGSAERQDRRAAPSVLSSSRNVGSSPSRGFRACRPPSTVVVASGRRRRCARRVSSSSIERSRAGGGGTTFTGPRSRPLASRGRWTGKGPDPDRGSGMQPD
jgi:hypothetical protein